MAAVTSSPAIHAFKPVFLAEPGEPPVPWRTWIAMFEIHLVASGFVDDTTAASIARKSALLTSALGVAGFRVFQSLTINVSEPYDDAKRHLAEHFDTQPNAYYLRAQFTRRTQQPGETVAQFLTALRELAKVAEITTALDDRIRDQFVAFVRDDRLREKLFQEPTNKTLPELLVTATLFEKSVEAANAMSGGGLGADLHPALPAVAPAVAKVERIGYSARMAGTAVGTGRRSGGFTCFGCGKLGHRIRAAECPARRHTCERCRVVGHFVSHCQGASAWAAQSSSLSGFAGRRGRSPSPGGRPSTSSMVTLSPVLLEKQRGQLKRLSCQLGDSSVDLLLDLGSEVSVVGGRLYDEVFSGAPLQQPDVRMQAYGALGIDCRGYFEVPVTYQGVRLPTFRFYVTRRGDSLMGVDLFDALGFKVQPPISPTTVNALSTVSLSAYPILCKSFGIVSGFQHKPRVDVSVLPVRQPMRRLAERLREPVSKAVLQMEREGIIERIDSSPWVSNIVPVKKPDGSIRVCVDLSEPNKAVIPDQYPLPTMEELSCELAGATIFSKLDLKWGYLQISLAEESRDLTAFVCLEGLFRFTRLPFGLCSAPSAFQQMISLIIKSVKGAVNLLDDIFIYGRTVAEHDARLRAVLDLLQQHNCTVNLQKCVIGVREVEFNGHVISAMGARPLISHVDAIVRLPVPSSCVELKRFLSTAGYLLKFVPHFATIAEPLRALLRDGVEWLWSAQCQRAFDCLKQRISEPPVLAHFDVKATTTYLTCDASDVGLGACLSQRQGGVDRPIAFASRALSSPERGYNVTEREGLACLWAAERFHFYLYGRKFVLRTDHEALRTLLSAHGAGRRPMRLQRWCERLFEYSFEPQYVRGVDNCIADLLSRAALDGPTPCEVVTSTVYGMPATSRISQFDLSKATLLDAELREVLAYVRTDWPTSRQGVAPTLRAYYAVRDELSSYGGDCLARGERAVIPVSLREQVLRLAHEGHPGIVKMKARCRDTVWWPGLDKDIERFIRECSSCVRSGKAQQPTTAPLQPLPCPRVPWQRIGIDIFGEVKAAPEHQKFVVVVLDHYSHWPELTCCGTVTSTSIIEFLTTLFCRYGLPEQLVSDNGPQFKSAQFEDFLRVHGIQHNLTSVYHPQSNGAVERFNRVLKEHLRTGLLDGIPFARVLQQVLATQRSIAHSLTGVSPAKLFLGREMSMPLCGLAPTSLVDIEEADAEIRQRVQFKQHAVQQYTDAKRHARLCAVRAGDYVRIRLPTVPHKLAPVWSEPMLVKTVRGSSIELVNGQRWNSSSCLLHRPVLRSSSPGSASLGVQGVGPWVRVEEDDDDEDAGIVYEWTSPVTVPAAVPPVIGPPSLPAARPVAGPVVGARPGQEHEEEGSREDGYLGDRRWGTRTRKQTQFFRPS